MKTKITLLLIACLTLISSTIYLNNLDDYENIGHPSYIQKDNTNTNSITDKGATLGRVLFYDKKLSKDNTIACASCHLQEFAFGDTAKVSVGVNGVTGRHSMRLVNARFSTEVHAFWDERAATIEAQTTMPIQDHVEMGYSGLAGDPDLNDLIIKMNGIAYYTTLFEFVYGDNTITEERIQFALAQFVRSIQSYDSKYDVGRAQVANNNVDFPNFTTSENAGKRSYFKPPPQGGTGCFRCHGGSEFSLIDNCKNNGVIGVANSATGIDLTNTKAPTLRDLVNPQGLMNGPFMHDGSLNTLMDVVNHYNDLVETAANTNLDFRLQGNMHDINLTQTEKDDLVAFLKTLTGSKIYTEEKWSSPFNSDGDLTIVGDTTGTGIAFNANSNMEIGPNPTTDFVNINNLEENTVLTIYNVKGEVVKNVSLLKSNTISLSSFEKGIYFFEFLNSDSKERHIEKIIKE